MTTQPILRGLTTVAYQTTDMPAAQRWYTELFGIEPYFVTPPYVEFRIGDYQHEFGLIEAKYLPDLGATHSRPGGPGGAIVYWHVDDAPATFERLLALGAKPHQPPRDFGRGFIGASVVDPFGNVLGIMYNPHYLEVLHAKKAA